MTNREIIRLTKKLFNVCLDANMNGACIFIDLSGHVDNIRISIAESKYDYINKKILPIEGYKSHTHYDYYINHNDKEVCRYIEDVIEYIQNEYLLTNTLHKE